MLKRIRIRGYKSLSDVDVELEPLTVLFGPNAAGKSNFLDALQLLSKLATSRTLKEAFESPYRGKPLESFQLGSDGLRGLVAQERLRFSIEADLHVSDAVAEAVNRQILELRRPAAGSPNRESALKYTRVRERDLRYRIEVELLPQRGGLLRVADEYLAALNRKGEPTRKRKPFIERQGERFHLRQEGQAHPTYHERFLDHSILSMPLYKPHYPHVAAARQEFESWQFFYFEPRERMRALNPVKEVRHIGLMGEELAAFLNTLKIDNPAQFRGTEKTLRLLVPQIEAIDLEVNDFGEVELSLREGGVSIPARVLSEGTLRLLGLLALAGAGEAPTLVGFEEPENGVHPRRIEVIAELLRTRRRLGRTQYIVTTHSPTLLDRLPEASLFVARRGRVGTTIDRFSTWGPLGRKSATRDALMAEGDRESVSRRLLRGDFDE